MFHYDQICDLLCKSLKSQYSFMPNCRVGVEQNAPGGTLSRFLKMRGGDVFRSFSYNN